MKILAAVSLPLAALLAAALAPLEVWAMIVSAAGLAGTIGTLMARRTGVDWSEAAVEGGLIALAAICLAMLACATVYDPAKPGSGYAVAGGCGLLGFVGIRRLVSIANKRWSDDE